MITLNLLLHRFGIYFRNIVGINDLTTAVIASMYIVHKRKPILFDISLPETISIVYVLHVVL